LDEKRKLNFTLRASNVSSGDEATSELNAVASFEIDG
jgi:hypothetical protein